jgi:hypothetical protein
MVTFLDPLPFLLLFLFREAPVADHTSFGSSSSGSSESTTRTQVLIE